jgi:putative ABC transport system ATP-binding protein
MRASAELVPVRRAAAAPRAELPEQRAGAGEWSGRFPVADPGGAGVRTYDLVKDYGSGPGAVRALNGISVEVQPNTFTAIMGPSGSGKSTLLHCMAGLDAPTSGRVFLGPTDLTSLPEKKLTRLRRERVGFVFQSYALLPQLSVRQNIVLPLEVANRKIDEQWLRMVVEALDLGKVLKQRATKLSGGQQQRVAMARALLPRPDVVFADEPTGALDAPTAREMLQFLRTSVHQLGQTIVMVTHDPLAAEHTDHVLLLHQGGLAAQIANPTAPVVLEALTVLDRMPAAGWQTGGYRAAMAPPNAAALPAGPRLALPAGPSAAARPA